MTLQRLKQVVDSNKVIGHISSIRQYNQWFARMSRFNVLWLLFILLFITKISIGFFTLGQMMEFQVAGRLLGTLGVLGILFSFSFLFKGKARLVYFFAGDLLITAVSLLDLIFIRHFGDIMTLRTIPGGWGILNAATPWWVLLRPQDVFWAADLIVLGLMFCSAGKKNRPTPVSRLRRNLVIRLTGFALSLIIGLLLSYKAYDMLEANQPGITRTFYSKFFIAQTVGNLEFHALDVIRSVKTSLPVKYSPAQVTALEKWLQAGHPASSKDNNPLFGAAAGKNLIVIQVESLQEFVIGKTINGQEITPNLNRFLGQSLYFDHYYGETWDGGTSDAEFLSNASLYPVSRGSAFMDYPLNHYVSIGSTLTGEGYRTMALEADVPGFWDLDLMIPSLGFQQVVNAPGFKQDSVIGMGLADKSMFRQGLQKIEQMKEPFYSFFVTLSSHYPFEIPPQEKTINVAPYQNTEFGNYLESVHYTDQAIGEFLDQLSANGMLDHSVVAIYGDHPAPLDRHNRELLNFLGAGKTGMDDYHWLALQKVPFILHLPGDTGKGVISKTGGHVDLFPTLLGVMGKDPGQYPLLGHDLLNSQAPALAISRNGAMYYEGRLYNVSGKAVYDLKTGQPLPWNDTDPALNLYKDYLTNTDLIIRYDLQKRLNPSG